MLLHVFSRAYVFKGVIEFDLFDKYYVIVNEKQLEGRYVAAKLTLDFLTH